MRPAAASRPALAVAAALGARVGVAPRFLTRLAQCREWGELRGHLWPGGGVFQPGCPDPNIFALTQAGCMLGHVHPLPHTLHRGEGSLPGCPVGEGGCSLTQWLGNAHFPPWGEPCPHQALRWPHYVAEPPAPQGLAPARLCHNPRGVAPRCPPGRAQLRARPAFLSPSPELGCWMWGRKWEKQLPCFPWEHSPSAQ